MKQNKKLLILSVTLTLVQPMFSVEFGKNDGGEYCYRIPGVKTGGMYPDVSQLQAYERSMDRSSDQHDDTPQEILDHAPYFEGDMNFESIKNLFPIFQASVNGYLLTYFDSGSTAQMPQSVLDAIVQYYETYKANVGRGQYVFAERSTQMFEDARIKIARFIGAQKRNCFYFRCNSKY